MFRKAWHGLNHRTRIRSNTQCDFDFDFLCFVCVKDIRFCGEPITDFNKNIVGGLVFFLKGLWFVLAQKSF